MCIRDSLIIVPDQFTMQTQMDLVTMHPCKGIMNIDVLSFGRLSHRIIEEVGADERPVLDLSLIHIYYIDIIKMRYMDDIVFESVMPEAMFSLQIPKLVIQPLVENAVKYATNKMPVWNI